LWDEDRLKTGDNLMKNTKLDGAQLEDVGTVDSVQYIGTREFLKLETAEGLK
jgi:hypothetical protein